jgi:hypothetical protein
VAQSVGPELKSLYWKKPKINNTSNRSLDGSNGGRTDWLWLGKKGSYMKEWVWRTGREWY